MARPAAYVIPDSRTPFPNTELALLTRNGRKSLAIGNCGGTGKGRIYFVDPQTGDCEFRVMPPFESGAYMLQTGPDGKLYIGGLAGSLSCYDPQTDRIDVLVKDQMHSITWGGCVTARHVVWSASPADACVYDWREKKLLHVLKPLDPESPPARYGHRVIEAPDGRILFAMNVPQCRLVLLDPITGERQAVVPEGLLGREWTRDATFLDEETLLIFSKGETLFYRYPSFELSARIAPPKDADDFYGRICVMGDKVYAMTLPDGSLRRLKGDRSGWETVCDGFAGDMSGTIHKIDAEHIGCINVAGVFTRIHLKSGKLFRRELESSAQVPSHAFCAVPELGKVYGAPFINMRFWELDTATGLGRDRGKASIGGGQVNQIVWDPQTRRVLLSCYASCTISALDPAAPGSFPQNPKVLAQVGDMQMRPKSIAHDGRHLWMASSPKYGHRGGALSRIDPLDGSHRSWRHIVKDQTPNRVVADPQRARVYVSTEIYADCDSAPAMADTAQLVSFDTKELKIAAQAAPIQKADALLALALLSPGRVLVLGRDKFYAWEPESERFTELGAAPKDFKEATAGPDGRLYASAEGHVGRLQVEGGGITFEKLAPGAGKFLHIAGGRLWYVVDPEVCSIDVSGE